MSIEDKLLEIKKIGIIKDFKAISKPNGEMNYDVEFFEDLPPKNALKKLDFYLAEKYSKAITWNPKIWKPMVLLIYSITTINAINNTIPIHKIKSIKKLPWTKNPKKYKYPFEPENNENI